MWCRAITEEDRVMNKVVVVWMLVSFLLLFSVAGTSEEAADGSTAVNVDELRKQAEAGHPIAQFNLGVYYFNGEGEPKDLKEAVKWWTRAAEQGNVGAQFNLGLCYADGKGVPKDQKEAVKWYTRAAEQGDTVVQVILGNLYENGKGVPKDMKEAVKWWTRAAEQGNVGAQFNLGLCYADGKGVPKDPKEAVKWYTLAAEQGDATAQNNLGGCYENGEGVPKDLKQAVKWYTRAAEQGDYMAQCNLGLCYKDGEGVPKDLIKAYMWLNLAAAEDQIIAKNREIAAKEMTPDQIAEAQRLSAAFVPKKEGAVGSSPTTPGDVAMVMPDTSVPPKGTGTAFTITADGYLVTAAHVVANAVRVEVYGGGQALPATVVARDAVNDVAVLKVEGAYSPVRLVSSGGLKLGTDLFTVGFPDVQVQGAAPKLTKGSLSGLLGPADDPRYFQLSNPIQPGNSGGAVANEKGEVVGVLVGMLDLLKTIERTGQAPQNVNFALKSSYVLPLLETVPGLSEKIAAVKSPVGDAYQAVTDATVMVVVY
ncbi:MAG: SEL1-like repeat protein [Candidatus Hydrogenedentes bacterium]|nr:SEL1-like repeat protein [Candidatus Hydrogenedentota bacterium]